MFHPTPSEVSYRPLNALGLLLCFSAMAFALLYLEGHLGLESCPLCSAARLIILLQAGLFLVALVHNPRALGQRIYAVGGLLAALLGMAVSGRHIWLQILPGEPEAACGTSLKALMETLPLLDALITGLNPANSCAEVQWRFAGLTIPQQAFALFLLLALLSLKQLRRVPRRNYFS